MCPGDDTEVLRGGADGGGDVGGGDGDGGDHAGRGGAVSGVSRMGRRSLSVVTAAASSDL